MPDLIGRKLGLGAIRMKEPHIQIPEHITKKRLHRGSLGSIEQDEYCDIITAFVYLVGGQARRQKIIDSIHNVYSSQFTEADYALLQSQNPPKERWVHNIDWAKRKLVQQAVLLVPAQSPYGTWVLSEKGTQHATAFVKEE